MEDLIRRSDAIKAFCMDCKGQSEPCEHSDTCKTMKVLRSRKKIPAAEPKQGEWIITERDNGNKWWTHRKCSKCGGGVIEPPGVSAMKFCPNCGASMEGIIDE